MYESHHYVCEPSSFMQCWTQIVTDVNMAIFKRRRQSISEPRGAKGAKRSGPSKRSHIEGVSEQEEPSEELQEQTEWTERSRWSKRGAIYMEQMEKMDREEQMEQEEPYIYYKQIGLSESCD